MSANPKQRATPITAWESPAEVCRRHRRYYLQILEEGDTLPAPLLAAVADSREATYAAIFALTRAIDAHELGLGLGPGAQVMADWVCREADMLIAHAAWRVAVFTANASK